MNDDRSAQILEELTSDDLDIAMEAAESLQEDASLAASLAPKLQSMLSADEKASRRGATIGLAHSGDRAQIAVPRLCDLLLDVDACTRYYAAVSLGNVTPLTNEACDALVNAFGDYQRAKQKALWEADGNEDWCAYSEALEAALPASMPSLRRGLLSSNRATRAGVSYVLEQAGSSAHEALPEIIQVLNGMDPEIVDTLLSAIENIGNAASSSVAVVLSHLSSESEITRAYAALALASIGAEPSVAIESIRASAAGVDPKIATAMHVSLSILGDNQNPELVSQAREFWGYAQLKRFLRELFSSNQSQPRLKFWQETAWSEFKQSINREDLPVSRKAVFEIFSPVAR